LKNPALGIFLLPFRQTHFQRIRPVAEFTKLFKNGKPENISHEQFLYKLTV